MKIGFLITGRMKSTRLPKKLTLKLLNKEVIKWMIMRAKLVFANDEIIIATSNNAQDNVLQDIAQEMDIKCFRGHEEDVVLRLYEAAKENDLEYIINITADCPLFGYDYIERIKNVIRNKEPDLITALDLPHGFFVYAIKVDAFKKVIEMKKTDITEVWGDYFYSNPNLFRVEKLSVEEYEKRPNYRLTIDYPEDFEVFEKIFEHFGENTFKTSSKNIIEFLDKNPEIAEINLENKLKYQQRWESQSATKIEKQ